MRSTCAMARLPVLWCVLFLFAVCYRCEEEEAAESSLEEIVRTLKGQVSALLERRQEDYKLLEQSLRTTLEKNSELATLRSEVQSLRREVSALRGPTASNQQKNDHLTVQWLATAVGELRNEIAEVAATYNASAELQQKQELDSELALIRGDVASFRHELESLQAEGQQTTVRLAQAEQEVAAVRARGQAAAAQCLHLEQQLEEVRTEWRTSLKSGDGGSTAKLIKEHENDIENSVHSSVEDKRYRHQRVLRKQVRDLEAATKRLSEFYSQLQHHLRRVEKRLKNLHYEKQHHPLDELRQRVTNLEIGSKISAKSMFNISRQLAGVDKLHLSMLQLLESVESVENKVDRSVPDLQREISKMEFNMAQMTSSVALLKEEQDNQKATVKALGGGLAATQDKVDAQYSRVNALQAHLLNFTNHQKPQVSNHQSPIVSGVETPVLTANETDPVSAVVEELTRVQAEYQAIVNKLPHDCGDVRESVGLHLIAPGPGSPLVTSCDHGWTVVQRRVDGSQEFNRKWSDYSVGFGTPSGEFWLGNEALHRLTAENCSSLQVNLRDIYGKYWIAEYEEFSISGKEDGYRLHVAEYKGNASDALDYQNRMQFSAIDSDRDISNTHCAGNYEGGWWFSHCQHANLNGRYNLGLTWFDASKNEWIAVAWSEMKVRRRPGCVPKDTT